MKLQNTANIPSSMNFATNYYIDQTDFSNMPSSDISWPTRQVLDFDEKSINTIRNLDLTDLKTLLETSMATLQVQNSSAVMPPEELETLPTALRDPGFHSAQTDDGRFHLKDTYANNDPSIWFVGVYGNRTTQYIDTGNDGANHFDAEVSMETEHVLQRWDADFYDVDIFIDFVLTGDRDLRVTGYAEAPNSWRDVDGTRANRPVDELAGYVVSYTGNSGNNTFTMAWGQYRIDLVEGGNNTVNLTGGTAREIIGGSGNDIISVTGLGAADLIDLRNGGNNSVSAEGWANIIGGNGDDIIVSHPTFNNGSGIHADLSAGGDNIVRLLGAASSVTLGAGNDIVEVTNQWNNNGHPGNWSSATIDLSLGGNNWVQISGDTHTSGPTRAHITLGHGDDTVHAGNHTVVTILGANSTGNDTITLGGSAGAQGKVHTGTGHTTINWVAGNYAFEFGSGDLTMTVRGDVYYRFVFDGSERTANDTLTLNNWREGGEIHTGQGSTNIVWNHGDYSFQFGSGDLTFTTGGQLHHRFVFNGSERTANDTLTLNNWREGGEIHTGHGSTNIVWNYGNYSFQFGSGDLNFTTGADLHNRFVFNGSDRTANDTLTLNNSREGGVVHTGEGHTIIEWNSGAYDFHFGSGDLTMSINHTAPGAFHFDGSGRTATDSFLLGAMQGGTLSTGSGSTTIDVVAGQWVIALGVGGENSINVSGQAGIVTVLDANGLVIIDRVDGESQLAQSVHTLSAHPSLQLNYSLDLGDGVDKVRFFAESGSYQVTSSAENDIFQLDLVYGFEGADYEVFDFKWGADKIIDGDNYDIGRHIFEDDYGIRVRYLEHTGDYHKFELVAAEDVGAYKAGHVWMTLYSHDLPDWNFL